MALRSIIETKKLICAENTQVHKEHEKKKDGEPRLMWSEFPILQNSELEKKRDTELGQYIERKPNEIHEKSLELKTVKYRRDLTQKCLGNKKIKRNK